MKEDANVAARRQKKLPHVSVLLIPIAHLHQKL